ncbi:MAG: hypothetical protein ACRDWA_14745 [Acidimicrobiia bacterium]
MSAIDSSVAVPAVVGWHESHKLCRKAAAKASIPSNELVEAYSVLTRIPPPRRLSSAVAADVLSRFFDRRRMLFPSRDLLQAIVTSCGAAGIAGEAVRTNRRSDSVPPKSTLN